MSGLSPAEGATDQRWYHLAQPLFFHYGAGDGLPSGAVAAVAQDERGFIWLATSDGLVRWDGHSMRPVTAGPDDVNDALRVIQPGPDGTLWLGTGRGLVRFDPVTESFERVPHEREFAVLDLAPGPGTGVVWLAAEEGVIRVDVASGESRAWLQDRDARVFDVLVRGPEVWAGTESGLFRKPEGSAGFEPFRLGADVPPGTRIASLLRTSGGEIWVGTARRGVFVIDGNGEVAPLDVTDLAGEWIYAMVEVEPGVVWLGTFGAGIVEVLRERGLARRLQHNRLVRHSLLQDEVYTLYRDRAGRIWAGTRRGLSVHDPRQRALRTVFGDTGNGKGIRDEGVRSVHAASDGTVWLGLGESGVDGIDPRRGRIATVAADPEQPETALPAGAVETIAELDDGTLIIGSNWGVYERRGERTLRIDAAGGPGDRYVGAVVARGRELWAGGTAGLWHLESDDDGWRAEPVEARLTDTRVSELALAPDGGLVVGTWNGINWLDGEGRLLHAIPGGRPDGPIDGSAFVTALRFDEAGRLWMGTDGGGLYRISEAGNPGAFTRLGREEGLPSNVVRAMEFDDEGRAWVATTAGLAVVHPDSLSVHALEAADGDLLAPYARNASARTNAGELLFGGDGGLTIVRPADWRAGPKSVPVAIVRLAIGDEAAGDHGRRPAADPPALVPPDGNRISIEFAALDYGATRDWRYRYRLEGYETTWHEVGRDHRTATYTSLPPGDYRFVVQGDDRSGGWMGNEASLPIRVDPAWYQTAWARVAIAIAFLALVAVAVLVWNRRLRRRQQQLEALVRERTRALEEKSRELAEASTTDALTGLRNRRFLDDNMARDVALAVRRYRDGLGRTVVAPDLLIFLVDFDAFKRVNDNFGHAGGDAVLIEMRRRLQRLFRETDYLVRWGGEEFLVIARNVTRDHAEELAERLRRLVADEPFTIEDGQQVGMTCSIGVVPFPFDPEQPDALNWEECTEIADRCLYAAKRAGRNAWFYASRGPNDKEHFSVGEIRIDFWTLVEDDVLALSSNREADRTPDSGV